MRVLGHFYQKPPSIPLVTVKSTDRLLSLVSSRHLYKPEPSGLSTGAPNNTDLPHFSILSKLMVDILRGGYEVEPGHKEMSTPPSYPSPPWGPCPTGGWRRPRVSPAGAPPPVPAAIATVPWGSVPRSRSVSPASSPSSSTPSSWGSGPTAAVLPGPGAPSPLKPPW